VDLGLFIDLTFTHAYCIINLMKLSLSQYFTEISPYIDDNILNPAFLSQSKHIESLFSNCSSNFIIEIPLGTKKKTLDFSLCILKAEVDRLIDYWASKKFSSIFRNNPIWSKLFQFCSLWNDPFSSFYNEISNVWFEFDHLHLLSTNPSPSFFFSPLTLNRVFYPKEIDGEDRGIRDNQWLYGPVLSLLFGSHLTDRVKANISNCVEALPKYGIIFQIGVMMARGSTQLRVCTSIPFNSYIDYLQRIGWPGDQKHLTNILKSVSHVVDNVLLDIDVGDCFAPNIGIECSLNNKPCQKTKTDKLLKFLMDLNLCVEEKADSVQSWIEPGINKTNCRSRTLNVERKLSHIKLSLSVEGTLSAKAYLCFCSSLK
jgi:hypothetical protein